MIELSTTSGRPVFGALTLSLMDAGQPAGVRHTFWRPFFGAFRLGATLVSRLSLRSRLHLLAQPPRRPAVQHGPNPGVGPEPGPLTFFTNEQEKSGSSSPEKETTLM